jgi:DNA-binding NtrC family response regulator
MSQQAMRALMAFSWPGNVRQLENVIDRAVTMGAGRRQLDETVLPSEMQAVAAPAATPAVDLSDDGIDLPSYLGSIERDLISRALDRTGGNRNKAAELLKIKRTTLVEKLKRLRLS